MSDLTQAHLRTLLHYDPDTGVFTWLVHGGRAHPGYVAGTFDSDGYRNIKVAGKVRKAHRLAWLYVFGEFPADEIDHINGARSDNRISNLRPATSQENKRNRHVLAEGKSSKFIGVSWMSSRAKWRAYISHAGKFIHLGVFEDEQSAHTAHQIARKEVYGEFA